MLLNIARRLTEQDKSVGLITNDKAPDLVDIAFLSPGGSNVTEVTGN